VVDPCEGYFLNTRPERGEKMRMKFPGKRTQTFKKRKPTYVFPTYTFKRNPSQKIGLPQEIAHKKMVLY
jgi:hypothetical protein